MSDRGPLFNDNKLKLGTFSANCSSGMAVTQVEERWDNSWQNNIDLVKQCDEAGIEFMLPIARWIGYGGATDFHGDVLETVTWAAGLLAHSKNIQVFATVHTAYNHPIVTAKQLATIDQLGGGRVGLNVVAGWNKPEYDAFGIDLQEAHEDRYAFAQEWFDYVQKIWKEDEAFDWDGKFFNGKGVYGKPRPAQSRIPILNAAGSEEGRKFAMRNFIDVDSGPANQLGNYAGVDADSFTQEIRFSGEGDNSRWIAGLFYLAIDTDSDNGLKGPASSIVSSLDIGVIATLETDSTSVFGQVEYNLSDKLALTVGGRVIQEEKEYDMAIGVSVSSGNFTANDQPFIPNIFGAGSPFFLKTDTDDTLWAGKIQLDYRTDNGTLLYAGINRGVKAGSFNAPLLGAFLGAGGDSAIPYDEEVLTSFEAGFKSTLGDGNTRFNASYTDSTVEDLLLRNGSPLPPRDVEPTYAPKFQATGVARYAWDAMGGTLSWQGDWSYSDEYFYNLRNFDADKFDSYVMVNTQLGWANDDGWSLKLRVNNVTDERVGIQGFDLAALCGCNEVSYRAPRLVTLGIRKDF